jgi:hypothetical protein
MRTLLIFFVLLVGCVQQQPVRQEPIKVEVEIHETSDTEEFTPEILRALEAEFGPNRDRRPIKKERYERWI